MTGTQSIRAFTSIGSESGWLGAGIGVTQMCEAGRAFDTRCLSGLLIFAFATLGCVDLTSPWERNRSAAESRAPDASMEGHGGSASRGGSAVWPDASAEVYIGDSRTAVTSSSSSVDAQPGSGTYALPTGGTGGSAGMDGRAGIVASTATTGGGVAPASVTGGLPSGGTGGVIAPTSTSGGTGGVIAPTSASGGAPTGGMGGIFSFGGTFRFPSSMMGGFFLSSRVGGATGGNGSSSSQTGGSGGAVSSGSSTRSCGGVVEASDPSVCWYLGAASVSCAQTCNSHGGVSPNAAKQVGTAAQGGSASKCENLFNLLGYKVSVNAVQAAAGLGCHLKPNMPLPYAWASSPTYSDNDWESEVRIVCGCLL